MSNIVEPKDQEIDLQEGEELASLDDVGTKPEPQPEPEPEAAPEPDTEPDLPEKFAGKSQAELVAMIQEQERFQGRQSNELGELRRAVDELVKGQLAAAAPKEAEQEPDFFEDPEAAVERRIANHPAVKKAEEVSQKYAMQQADAILKERHPDIPQILQDPAFSEWVQANTVRRRMLEDAYQKFDVDAADELFSNWKVQQQVKQTAVASETVARKQAAKGASTGVVKGSGAAPTKKIYKRTDVVALMRDHPKRYAEIADEIMLAYKEGRVRS